MTRLNLLNAIADFSTEVMKEVLLPVRVQSEDETQTERPPFIYKMRLPDAASATKRAPYILHQVVNGDDEQTPGSPRESYAQIRSLFCVYGEDDQKGALRLLTVTEHFRVALLKQTVLANQFQLDLSEKLSALFYTDSTAPYFCAEMLSTWKIPSIEREVVPL